MRRTAAIVLAALACVAALALSHGRAQSLPATEPATSSTRFEAVDVLIDPGGTPLAAYQLEFVADADRVKLVGVEGGDHAAFRDPPYYDPAALSRSRVILAALSTDSNLPNGKTRVARLHLQIDGVGEPSFEAKVMVAASADERAIAAATAAVAPVAPQALEGDVR